MTKKFSLPRGTADILPDEVTAWQNLEKISRDIFKIYRYQEIRTPIFEETDLFARSLGQTTDVVLKQMLNLAKTRLGQEEQEEGGLSLRPEGTAAVVRSYIENSFDKKEPLSKFFYIGPMFRGERPQKGRLRHFHQIGVEAIGPNSVSPYLDAEILALAMRLLKDLGVQGPKLKINSLGSKEDKENISLLFRKKFMEHKKDLCEDCQSRFERNVFRVLDCKNESCRKVVNSAMGSEIHLPLPAESLQYFNEVQNTLRDLAVPYEVSRHLVRGLDYYTHTVFEITAEGLGSQDAVGAGGRYGGLIHELGGSPKIEYGAIGFALGIERILLSKGGSVELPDALNVFVVSTQLNDAFRLVQLLRRANISADMNFLTSSFKSQMGRANKLGARFALILGEEELKNGTVAVKDMQKSTQETIKKDDIVHYLRKALQ